MSLHPRAAKPYAARLKQVYLGNFATAEEAALHVARSLEGQLMAEFAELRGAGAARAAAARAATDRLQLPSPTRLAEQLPVANPSGGDGPSALTRPTASGCGAEPPAAAASTQWRSPASASDATHRTCYTDYPQPTTWTYYDTYYDKAQP